MAINQYTKLACGSLIPGKSFQVWDIETYINITAAQVAAITARPEVLGSWNIFSNVPNGSNFDIQLYQVRMKLLADVPSRPTLAAITAQETVMLNDAATAVTKRNATYAALATPLIGSLISSLSTAQQHNLFQYSKYMNNNGVVYNGKGRIISLQPNTKAPIEYSYILSEDGVWLVGAANPQWTDFIT